MNHQFVKPILAFYAERLWQSRDFVLYFLVKRQLPALLEARKRAGCRYIQGGASFKSYFKQDTACFPISLQWRASKPRKYFYVCYLRFDTAYRSLIIIYTSSLIRATVYWSSVCVRGEDKSPFWDAILYLVLLPHLPPQILYLFFIYFLKKQNCFVAWPPLIGQKKKCLAPSMSGRPSDPQAPLR